MPFTARRRLIRAIACCVFTVAIVSLAACSETTGAEANTSVEDVQVEDAETVYDGIYDDNFYTALSSYEGQVVALSADVSQVISDHAFTIAGGDVEPLLVITQRGTKKLEAGSVIKVTGVIHTAFDLPAVEDEVGVGLDEEALDEWNLEPYLELTSMDTNPKTEQHD